MAKKEETEKTTKSTNIRKCSCKHEWQDEKYGKGMRVFTPGNKCTSCGAKG